MFLVLILWLFESITNRNNTFWNINGELYLNIKDGIFECGQSLFQFLAVHDQLQALQQSVLSQVIVVANNAAAGDARAPLPFFALITTATSWLRPPGSALTSTTTLLALALTPTPTARPAFASHSTLSTCATFAPSSTSAAGFAFTSCTALGTRFSPASGPTSATASGPTSGPISASASTMAFAPGHMPVDLKVWSDCFFKFTSWFKCIN